MSKPGPKPMSYGDLKIRGSVNADARRGGSEYEPAFEDGRPSCLDFVIENKYARTKWYEYTKQLQLSGLLQKVDGVILARYCINLSVWRTVEQWWNSPGCDPIIEIQNANGDVVNKKPHPYIKLRASVQKDLRADEMLLGFNPSARASLGIQRFQKQKEESQPDRSGKIAYLFKHRA